MEGKFYKELNLMADGYEERIDFTGGISANKDGEGHWHILPVLHGGLVCSKGPFSMDGLARISRALSVKPVYFKEVSVRKGIYRNDIYPMLPENKKNEFGARDVWESIAVTLQIERERANQVELKEFRPASAPSVSEIQAHYIVNGLRSIEKCLSDIFWIYSDDLMTALQLRKARKLKALPSNVDVNAAVNAFFLHFGVIRDHLGRLMGDVIGLSKSVDSLNNLMKALSFSDLPNNLVIGYLISSENMAPDEAKGCMKPVGWLAEINSLRNYFVHHRPYGSLSDEKVGGALSVNEGEGLYVYKRFIGDKSKNAYELLDFLSYHYNALNIFLIGCARNLNFNYRVRFVSSRDSVNQDFFEAYSRLS